MKIEKPNKIAVCLNAPNLDRALEQKKALISIEDNFDVEWDLRAERFSGSYISFSQMINESIISTESEFMIFINPKSEVEPNDIYTIIEDLCNGYALSTVIAFGLWGCTKQLFREIGMFDERLIGSEYEDDDILVRMLEYDKAVNWRFEIWRYDHPNGTPISQNYFRGISANVFREKWKIDQDSKTISKNKKYFEEKALPKKIAKNIKSGISLSWMPFKESKYVSYGIFMKYKDLRINPPIECQKTLNTLSLYIKECDPQKVEIILYSQLETNLTIAISKVDFNEKTQVIPRFTFPKNSRYCFDKNRFLNGQYYNITAWHRNYILYNNTFKYEGFINIEEKFTVYDFVFLD